MSGARLNQMTMIILDQERCLQVQNFGADQGNDKEETARASESVSTWSLMQSASISGLMVEKKCHDSAKQLKTKIRYVFEYLTT